MIDLKKKLIIGYTIVQYATKRKDMLYILIGKNPIQVEDTHAWARWFEIMTRFDARHVGKNVIKAKPPFRKNKKCKRGPRKQSSSLLTKLNRWRTEEVFVSTVFLGLDHNYHGSGKPILFETMIFGGRYNDFQKRYTSWDDAKKSHQQVLEMLNVS